MRIVLINKQNLRIVYNTEVIKDWVYLQNNTFGKKVRLNIETVLKM